MGLARSRAARIMGSSPRTPRRRATCTAKLFELAVQHYQAAVKTGQQPAARMRAEDICARFIVVGSEHAVTIEQGQRASVFERLMEDPLGIEAFKAAADVTSPSLHGDQWPYSSCSAGLVREQLEQGSPLHISLQVSHSHYAESVSLRLRSKKQ